MRSMNAAEFCRRFGLYQREVVHGPIEVINRGVVTGYFLSPADYADFQKFQDRCASKPVLPSAKDLDAILG